VNGDHSTEGPFGERGSLVGLHPEDHGGSFRGMVDLWAGPSPEPAWSSAMDLDRRSRMHGTGYCGSGSGPDRSGPGRQQEQRTGVISRLACPHITRIEKVIFVVSIVLAVMALIFGRIA
jgi:hypothetical protein